MENLVNTASQKKVFIKQIKYVVAAIALNSLTLTTAPTIEPELIFYGECQKFLQEDVLRRIFRDQLQSEQQLFFPIASFPSILSMMRSWTNCWKRFPFPEERKVQGLYDAKSVQSDCRARCTKIYDESVKAQGSGVNNNQASLELALKEIQKEKIRSNIFKAVSKYLAVSLKNDHPSADKATKKTELENDKRGCCDSKLARWKNDALSLPGVYFVWSSWHLHRTQLRSLQNPRRKGDFSVTWNAVNAKRNHMQIMMGLHQSEQVLLSI